ncbi:MAG: hypothetical protein IKC14_02625 [Kiritimatiellae bacterium]|nr:hypothetical protein [Kiritimatiellia bacterium]
MGTVKIGDAISAGWNIYKDNFGLVFLGCLITWLVSAVSCNVCLGPLLCGMFMVLARIIKKSEPKPEVGDVFKGFDKFLPAFLLVLVCGICYFVLQCILLIIPIIGWILLFIVAFAYGPILTWALMLIANRDMKWTEAVGFVLKATFNGKFTMPIVLGILAGIIGVVGIIACGIGIIFTMPLAVCIYAAAYEQVFGGEGGATSAEAPVEPEVVA